ncbi:Chaperone protein HscA [Buchnera aphidicola (Eriosoma grossulariae)]|uniref:Fe-S protein assembly chaperone HscA n=1 Tax=Buchnera aphidicola TaxID=9 RepID=UPI003463EFCE
MLHLNNVNKFKIDIDPKEKFSIGIDLGTTYSLVAIGNNHNLHILTHQSQKKLLPSVVYYGKEKIIIGKSAIKNIDTDVTNTITSIKRLMGLSISKIKNLYPNIPYLLEENKNNEVIIKTRRGKFSPYQISSLIIQKIINQVKYIYQRNIDYAVITVPAYFDDIQRNETKKAIMLAGLNNFRLLNEPTAAAIAYGLDNNQKGIIAIYDFGGGTFDFSLLKLNLNIFEVLATNGNSDLGGDDFDNLLSNYILSQLKKKKNNLTILEKQKIYLLAKNIKKKLSTKLVVPFIIDNIYYSITRIKFNSLIEPLINKTLISCSNAINDANLDLVNIDKIILVGGSTYIPFVQTKVKNFFKKKPCMTINPEEAVVLGAAIHANNLISKKDKNKILLLDVLPLSLGIEVIGGVVEKIIMRNTTIPTSKTKEFTTYQDGQTSISIHILQGERELIQHCRSLQRFILKGLPPKPAGSHKIFITFEINADGILNVIAEEKKHKIKKKLIIHNIFNIKKNFISKMIQEFNNYFSEDKKEIKKIEVVLKAKKILEIVYTHIKINLDYIHPEKLKLIQNIYLELKIAIKNKNISCIEKNIKILEENSQYFINIKQKNIQKKYINQLSI